MMKRVNLFYTSLLLLVTNISAYAGVTDGQVTAYRFSINPVAIIFTNTLSDDPDGDSAPLGAGFLGGPGELNCTASFGESGIYGKTCTGTSGDPVETYTCVIGSTPNASNTTWCLFSETPRSDDGQAWAVKYVNGEIPTNDGTSIVRCGGADKFDSVNGCQVRTPSEISIENGFIKLDTTDGNVPFSADCSLTAHNGRMVVDDVNAILYICTVSGWEIFSSSAPK